MSVSAIIDEIEHIVNREMEAKARQIEYELRGEANKRTGRLAASIHVTTGGYGGARTGIRSYYIGTDLDYAKYVNDGRGWVYPKDAKALRYYDETYHGSSRPYKGSHFVERVASRWK